MVIRIKSAVSLESMEQDYLTTYEATSELAAVANELAEQRTELGLEAAPTTNKNFLARLWEGIVNLYQRFINWLSGTPIASAVRRMMKAATSDAPSDRYYAYMQQATKKQFNSVRYVEAMGSNPKNDAMFLWTACSVENHIKSASGLMRRFLRDRNPAKLYDVAAACDNFVTMMATATDARNKAVKLPRSSASSLVERVTENRGHVKAWLNEETTSGIKGVAKIMANIPKDQLPPALARWVEDEKVIGAMTVTCERESKLIASSSAKLMEQGVNELYEPLSKVASSILKCSNVLHGEIMLQSSVCSKMVSISEDLQKYFKANPSTESFSESAALESIAAEIDESDAEFQEYVTTVREMQSVALRPSMEGYNLRPSLEGVTSLILLAMMGGVVYLIYKCNEFIEKIKEQFRKNPLSLITDFLGGEVDLDEVPDETMKLFVKDNRVLAATYDYKTRVGATTDTTAVYVNQLSSVLKEVEETNAVPNMTQVKHGALLAVTAMNDDLCASLKKHKLPISNERDSINALAENRRTYNEWLTSTCTLAAPKVKRALQITMSDASFERYITHGFDEIDRQYAVKGRTVTDLATCVKTLEKKLKANPLDNGDELHDYVRTVQAIIKEANAELQQRLLNLRVIADIAKKQS